MIPYMQLTTIPLALLLAVVYALDKGMPFWEVAVIILAIYLVVQIIQDFFLVPHIVGKSMNLRRWGFFCHFRFGVNCLVFWDFWLQSPSRAYALSILRN